MNWENCNCFLLQIILLRIHEQYFYEFLINLSFLYDKIILFPTFVYGHRTLQTIQIKDLQPKCRDQYS
jgi:hypothetical protein